MALNGHVGNGNIRTLSSGMYHNLLHVWGIGLTDPLIEFTLKEIAVNARNENKLGDVL